MKPRQELALKETGRTDGPAVLVVGSGAAGGIAVRLDESATVRFATAGEEIAQRARSNGLDTYRLDVTDAKSLQPVEGVDVAVVAGRLDRRTLLIAQLLQVCCGVDQVVAAVADDTYSEASADVDIELVSLDEISTGALSERVPRLAQPG